MLNLACINHIENKTYVQDYDVHGLFLDVEMFFEGMMDYCYFYSCEYFIPCNENRQDYAQNRV